MDRRSFLAASGALGMGFPAAASADAFGQEPSRQVLELIEYRLPVGARRNAVGDFYRDVAIPALNRLGLGPVGVFGVRHGPNRPSLFVLISHPDANSVVTKAERLLSDDVFRQDGRDFVEGPLADPMFVRAESSLMLGFKEMPTVEVPTDLLDKPGRIYEFRIYESHSMVAAKKKVHMFDEGGEIAIFRKTGLRPVFFGETFAGQLMPNLTYLLVFENMAARDAAWGRFGSDPDWIRLREDPTYADTVSAITDYILTPTAYSQV